ncbi:MAG: ABC transporter permease [Paraburkholderia sp.]|jgi:NitT/TauT family transport system permease protein|nr:ABC transporter permease [Paraburkholderia sp.]
MSDTSLPPSLPPQRADVIVGNDLLPDSVSVVAKPLSLFERVYNLGWIRRLAILVALAAIWEIYGRTLNNPLLFPTFTDTVTTFAGAFVQGELPRRAWASLQVLLIGYGLGVVLAALLTALAISSRIGTDFLETMTSMLNPLPAIALLPLALIWFGLGNGSLVFVLIHSVTWAVALNTHSGFRSVSNTLRMVGRNYGLRGPAYVMRILIPAAFANILTGLKVGWAFAWRTLIAAELVFGVSSGSGGLGWFIYQAKNALDIPSVFAGLFCVILIGLVIENLVFGTLEKYTIRRWGMQS